MQTRSPPIRVTPPVFLLLVLLSIGLALIVSCKPTTQPMELADSQSGFSTQNDQRKYIDIDDRALRLYVVNVHEQLLQLAQQSNATAYNYSIPEVSRHQTGTGAPPELAQLQVSATSET